MVAHGHVPGEPGADGVVVPALAAVGPADRASSSGLQAARCSSGRFGSLGPNLTDTVVTRKAHALVSTGPYRWVRHPFYDSVVPAPARERRHRGELVHPGCPAPLVFVLMAVRTGVEERNLLARFGESYRTYRDATGRFLPRLSRNL